MPFNLEFGALSLPVLGEGRVGLFLPRSLCSRTHPTSPKTGRDKNYAANIGGGRFATQLVA
jgi:hypothetical protein